MDAVGCVECKADGAALQMPPCRWFPSRGIVALELKILNQCDVMRVVVMVAFVFLVRRALGFTRRVADQVIALCSC